jgi:hypothetical protein
MAASQPIQFIHGPVNSEHLLIESVCPVCGRFLAASKSPTILMIVEAAHICSPFNNKEN